MWDGHSSRIRAYLRGQRRPSAVTNPNSNVPRIHLKRSEADIVLTSRSFGVPPRIIPARLLINDIDHRGLYVFCQENIQVETEIALQIQHLNNLHVRGKVFAAHLFSLSQRVLTESPLRYRLGIRFQFDNEHDRVDFQKFCKKVSEDFLREIA